MTKINLEFDELKALQVRNDDTKNDNILGVYSTRNVLKNII